MALSQHTTLPSVLESLEAQSEIILGETVQNLMDCSLEVNHVPVALPSHVGLHLWKQKKITGRQIWAVGGG